MSTGTPPITGSGRDLRNPGYQGFLLLWIGFTAAPILFGLDKFFNQMVEWETYLWEPVATALPGSASEIMMAVGVVEIAAGVLTAFLPRVSGYVIAGWLGVIIVNLLLVGDFFDVALRDFGLMLGALTLARLATSYQPGLPGEPRAGESATPATPRAATPAGEAAATPGTPEPGDWAERTRERERAAQSGT